MSNYQFGDIKYYYEIHCAKQKALGNTPVSYARFTRRLQKMNLHDAIYTPRSEHNVRDKKPKTTIADKYRRRQALNEENVQYIDFSNTRAVEESFRKKKTNKVETPKPKPSLLDRFISLFK